MMLNIERKLISRKSISKEIQSTGNVSRFILASFNYDALEITFPCEIKKYFNNKGYTVTEIDFESLKDTDVAIILIKGKKLLKQWHLLYKILCVMELHFYQEVFGSYH